MRVLTHCRQRFPFISHHFSRQFRTTGLSDPKNVWKLTQQDHGSYWTGYLSTRPKYTDSFYDLIYNHHATRSRNRGSSTSLSVAHDVGAGPGHVAAKLAARFSHVVVSDNNASHLEYAKRFLSRSGIPQSSFSYVSSRAEELLSKDPGKAGSADLVACALTFPLLDTLPALQTFYTLLRPGGTLAIWFYGRAHFAEPEYARTCQPLLDEIIDHHYTGVIQGHGSEHLAQWKCVAERIACWLDYIPFSETEWANVTRYKWNTSWAGLEFFTERACGCPLDVLPREIKQGEIVIEQEDRKMWEMSWDISELREFVKYIFPFERMDDEPVRPLWARLEREVGFGQQRLFSWPAVLILATKKQQKSTLHVFCGNNK